MGTRSPAPSKPPRRTCYRQKKALSTLRLQRIEAKGWIEASWGLSENKRRAKFYALTPEGRIALEAQANSWNEYVAAVGRVMSEAPGEAS